MQIAKKTLTASLITVCFLALAACGSVSETTAPVITQQPLSRALTVGQSVTFSVEASGTPALTYQWTKSGKVVSGATSASFTTRPATVSDNGAQFTVIVSNAKGTVTSNSALLTVSEAVLLLLNSSASSLSFGSVTVSSSSVQKVTLTNAGKADVTISQVLVAGAGFDSTGGSSGLILAPGQSTTLTSTFAPSATGGATGKITVSSNASNSPASILLSGSGVASGAHSVTLSWTDGDSGITGYHAYSSTVPGGPFVRMTAGALTAPTFRDASVQSGRTYYYVVTALNASNQESVYSSEVTAIVP